MSTLQQNLNSIKTEKDTKIIPENIKKDVQIFDIVGTLESGGNSKCKIFNSTTEMNASSNNNDGDVALIYGINPVTPNTTGFNANILILDETCPADVEIPEDGLQVVTGTYSMYLHPKDHSNTDIYIDTDFGGGGETIYLWTRQQGSTGDYINRSTDFGNIIYLNNVGSYMYGPQTITELKITNPSATLWNYLKFGYIDKIEVYVYNGKTSTWQVGKSQMDTNSNDILSGKTVLGGEGLITGTLNLSVKKSYKSIPTYNNSCFSKDPSGTLSISAPDTYAIIDATTHPNIGDKRWVFLYGYVDMGMGSPDYWTRCLVLPEGEETLYYVPYDNFDILLGNRPSQSQDYDTTLAGYEITGLGFKKTPTGNQVIALTPGTTISSSLTTIDALSGVWGSGGLPCISYIATNAEIKTIDGTVLRPAGSKASEIKTTSGYYNVFGEWIQGTLS